MITRKDRKLLGLVHSIEAEFAEFEIINGNAIEVRNTLAGYELYDLEGKLIEEISPYRLMMEDSYKDVYIYDIEGKLISRDEYAENGSLIGKTIFETYINGSRIEKHYYFDNQQILKLGSHIIYDSEDKHLEKVSYDENENIDLNHIYNYNSKPLRKTKESITFKGDERIVKSYYYDEDDIVTSSAEISYYSQENIKAFSSFDEGGNLVGKHTYEYDFDLQGNWITKRQYWWTIGWGEYNLIPWTITRRKIQYY